MKTKIDQKAIFLNRGSRTSPVCKYPPRNDLGKFSAGLFLQKQKHCLSSVFVFGSLN